jgi:CDP-diacylglycerol--glycerol-3-phosphate 3-phosphatidyltransferase
VRFNIPNALTLLRIFLVPLLVVMLLTRAKEYLALLVFLVAALTDWLDGYWARRYKKVTTLGILLDPIADKLLVSATLISLVDLQEADAWAVCIIIGREFAVSGLRSIAASYNIVIAASRLGKIKTELQISAIHALNAYYPAPLWADVLLYVAVAVTVISGADYFFGLRKRIAEHQAASATAERA